MLIGEKSSFRLPRLCDGYGFAPFYISIDSKHLRYVKFLNQSEVKPKPTMNSTHAFSRAFLEILFDTISIVSWRELCICRFEKDLSQKVTLHVTRPLPLVFHIQSAASIFISSLRFVGSTFSFQVKLLQ